MKIFYIISFIAFIIIIVMYAGHESIKFINKVDGNDDEQDQIRRQKLEDDKERLYIETESLRMYNAWLDGMKKKKDNGKFWYPPLVDGPFIPTSPYIIYHKKTAHYIDKNIIDIIERRFEESKERYLKNYT